jgi:hypothetical protein
MDIDIEKPKPEDVAHRCKICLDEFSNEADYNEHIQSFETDEEYADHISERPEEE